MYGFHSIKQLGIFLPLPPCMGCESITGLTPALNSLLPIYIVYAVGQISFLRLNLFPIEVDQNYTAKSLLISRLSVLLWELYYFRKQCKE